MNQIRLANAKDLVAKDSKLASVETNDCVVYATAAAFDLSYDAAHAVVRNLFNREPMRGVSSHKVTKELMSMCNSPFTVNGKTVGKFYVRPSKQYRVSGGYKSRLNKVSTFIKEHPQGTYLILVRGHAIAAKDGVLIDNVNRGSANSRVRWAFEIK